MIQLYENEEVLLVIRKHWFVMLTYAVPAFIMFILGTGAYIYLPDIAPFIEVRINNSLLAFSYFLYLMLVIGLLFYTWIDYYLDTWIVTGTRVIDVEQNGFFSREVSEIPLSRVQDVTIEVHGLIPTLLKFGTIRLQTAGEREFEMQHIPHLPKIKDAVLKMVHAEQKRSLTTVSSSTL